MASLKKLIAKPLTPEDLNRMYKKKTGTDLKIVIAGQVTNDTTIDELFDTNNCFCLFIETLSEYNGHWTSFFRTKSGIYFLDSYGATMKQLAQLVKRLGYVDLNLNVFKIIENAKLPIFYSPVLYQSKQQDVSDCGRYAVLNCILHTLHMRKNKFYDLVTFNDYLIQYMRKHNILDYDDAVTLITKSI